MLNKLTKYIYYRDSCRLYPSQMPINTGVLRDLGYNHVKKYENGQVVAVFSENADKHWGFETTTIQPLLYTFMLNEI